MRLMMHLLLKPSRPRSRMASPTGAAAAFAPVRPCFLGGTREGTELTGYRCVAFSLAPFIDHIAFGKHVESFFSNL